jgi:hypothetical protein
MPHSKYAPLYALFRYDDPPRWRGRVFLSGFCLLTANVVFYLIWPHVRSLSPCGGHAIGIELGLVSSAMALILICFGKGWSRWVLAAVAILVLYLWFSWLGWLVQMEC